MPDNETNNNSLVPIHNTGLIKVGNIIKITDKVLKEYSERALAVFYKSVIIGEQEWMVENLNVDHFHNGDPIPEAKTDEEWIKAGEEQKPAWCYYDNDPENGKKYGKLYNWYAVNDPRGLSPKGWHVSNDEEWIKLTFYLGGERIGGGKLKEAGTTHWESPNIGATNETGFTALPGGNRNGDGSYDNIGSNGFWWMSTESNSTIAWYRFIWYYSSNTYRSDVNKSNGLSVRCIKDKI